MTRPVLAVMLALAVFLAAPLAAAGDASQHTVLQVYVRDGCPHCESAKAWLPVLQRQHPDLVIEWRHVDRDPAARDGLLHHSRAAGLWPPGVPTFVFGDKVLAGFDTPEHSGAALEALVSAATAEQADAIRTTWFGSLSVQQLGLPLFTFTIGLLDGFNPCAMWVLLFLLSMLVHLRDRWRMAWIAGTFVLVSGIIYYLFMAAWLNVFLAVGLSAALRIGLGCLAVLIGVINARDFFRQPGQSFSLSIPAAAKPGLYARIRRIVNVGSLPLALLSAGLLAVVVNVVELLCTAGLPALYTAILSQQGLDSAGYYTYLGLYIVGYLLDDTLMVGTAVLALSSRKLTESAGRWLKLVSGLVMLGLGVVMLVKPAWL